MFSSFSEAIFIFSPWNRAAWKTLNHSRTPGANSGSSKQGVAPRPGPWHLFKHPNWCLWARISEGRLTWSSRQTLCRPPLLLHHEAGTEGGVMSPNKSWESQSPTLNPHFFIYKTSQNLWLCYYVGKGRFWLQMKLRYLRNWPSIGWLTWIIQVGKDVITRVFISKREGCRVRVTLVPRTSEFVTLHSKRDLQVWLEE